MTSTTEQGQAGLIESHPRWVELAEKRADLAERRRKWQDRIRGDSEAHQAALAAWESRVALAVERGEDPPPRPQPLGNDVEHFRVLAEYERARQGFLEDEQRLLASLLPDVEPQARERIGEHVAAVQDLIDQIAVHHGAVNRDLADLSRCQHAADAEAHVRRSHRSSVTVDELLDAAERGVDLLAGSDVAGLGLSAVERDGETLFGFEGAGLAHAEPTIPNRPSSPGRNF